MVLILERADELMKSSCPVTIVTERQQKGRGGPNDHQPALQSRQKPTRPPHHLILHHLRPKPQGWRDGWVVKSTVCSSRGHRIPSTYKKELEANGVRLLKHTHIHESKYLRRLCDS